MPNVKIVKRKPRTLKPKSNGMTDIAEIDYLQDQNDELRRLIEIEELDNELDTYFEPMEKEDNIPNPFMGDYMYMADYNRWRDMHEPDYWAMPETPPEFKWILVKHFLTVFIILYYIINYIE